MGGGPDSTLGFPNVVFVIKTWPAYTGYNEDQAKYMPGVQCKRSCD